jgi:hypothetical protein
MAALVISQLICIWNVQGWQLGGICGWEIQSYWEAQTLMLLKATRNVATLKWYFINCVCKGIIVCS